MYTTDGHIIIALTAGHRAPCLHPTPSTDSRHRATERATGDAEQTGKADTHGGTDGGHRDSQGDRRSRSGNRIGGRAGERRRGTLGEIGQSKTGRATRRPSEPRRAARMPQRVQLPPQTQTGRRERQNAVSGAFRARYRYIISTHI